MEGAFTTRVTAITADVELFSRRLRRARKRCCIPSPGEPMVGDRWLVLFATKKATCMAPLPWEGSVNTVVECCLDSAPSVSSPLCTPLPGEQTVGHPKQT